MLTTQEKHSVMRDIMRLTRMHHSQVENKIKKLGIHRSQHMALMYISKNDGKVTQKDIAKKYDISEAAVSTTLKKLEQAGLIQKSSSSDARYNYLSLTNEGIEVVKESVDIFNEAEAKTFETLTDEEIETLHKIILKMQDSISDKKEKENETMV